jgi:hypothetical protein
MAVWVLAMIHVMVLVIYISTGVDWKVIVTQSLMVISMVIMIRLLVNNFLFCILFLFGDNSFNHNYLLLRCLSFFLYDRIWLMRLCHFNIFLYCFIFSLFLWAKHMHHSQDQSYDVKHSNDTKEHDLYGLAHLICGYRNETNVNNKQNWVV